MSLIELKNVDKTYLVGETQVHALRDVQLEIDEQSFAAFVGPSGSGKTTLLNLIGCLDKPTNGSIYVNGVIVADFSNKEAALFRGKNIGFIFQNFNLFPVLTVYENVEYPLFMIHNVPEKKRKERIMKYLDAVGMTDQIDKYPSEISGGQKQRAAIARALVTDPKIILADEPTANLDHENAFKIIELMKKMQRDLGTSFVFSTHDSKIVKEAKIIFTLEDGKIVNKEIMSNDN